mgnify:CR=1 FL=1
MNLKRFIRKRYNYKSHTEEVHHDRKTGHINVDNVHELRQTDRARRRGYKVSVPKLRRDTDQTLCKVQEVRQTVQVPEMRVHRSLT